MAIDIDSEVDQLGSEGNGYYWGFNQQWQKKRLGAVTYSSEPFKCLRTSTAYFVNAALTSIIMRAFGYSIGYIHRFENCNYLLLVH